MTEGRPEIFEVASPGIRQPFQHFDLKLFDLKDASRVEFSVTLSTCVLGQIAKQMGHQALGGGEMCSIPLFRRLWLQTHLNPVTATSGCHSDRTPQVIQYVTFLWSVGAWAVVLASQSQTELIRFSHPRGTQIYSVECSEARNLL